MKSNKGSISILMLLIVPVLAVGILLIYDYLNTYKLDNRVIKNTRNISEIQLSNNNAHLFENYGILAYLNQEVISHQIRELNSQVDFQNIQVDHYDLGIQSNFMEATEKASKNIITIEAVQQIHSMITPMMKSEKSNEFIERMKKFEKDVGNFLDFYDEVKKIQKLMTSRDPEPILQLIEENIEKRLDDTIKSYDLLMDTNVEHIGEQLSQYENLMNESIKKSNEWARRVDELRSLNREISDIKIEIKGLKSDIARINVKIDSLQELDDEYDALTYELSALKDQKSICTDTLTDLEKKWSQLIEEILSNNESTKPKLMERIAFLSGKVDELLFDLDPIENLFLPPGGPDFGNEYLTADSDVNMVDKIIYAEYWMGVLKSFDKGSIRNFDPLESKSKREGVIKGEVEYLVAGKQSDPQNVHLVKTRIFSLRTVANMIHITSDPQKTSQISRVTTALPAPWNMVAHGALVTLWSSAEGYMDMIALYKGKGHHFVKTEEEWQLSFDQLMVGHLEMWNDSIVIDGNQPSKGKVFYQDYLRLMLYFQPQEVTANRAMFLMASNLGKVSDQRFNLNQFSIGHQIELTYSVKSIDQTQSMMTIVNKY